MGLSMPTLQPPKIDLLDPAIKQMCIDLLLSGEKGAVNRVAKLAGISRQAVGEYKRDHLRPAIKTAAQVMDSQGIQRDTENGVSVQSQFARDVIKASPVRKRLEALWLTTEDAIKRASYEVVRSKDKDGNLVESNVLLTGSNAASVAPLLSQAHANLKLLGELTGELGRDAISPTVAIQIVSPAGSAPTVSTRPSGQASSSQRSCIIDLTPQSE